MALDKQKILNELGNVVNQLQSADCGCMGKLFSNSNQANLNTMANPAHEGSMRGCCHGYGCGHGCHGNAPGAGEPYSGNRHCMGFCNPPKLYADTYSYLNQNLMQPVVKEVYDDLKSITPGNTVMNDPMAAKMGLQGNSQNPGVNGMGGYIGNMPQNQVPGGAMGNQNNMSNVQHAPHVRFGNASMGNANNNTNALEMGNHQQMGQPMGHMGGMGAQIVNMMTGNTRAGSMPNQASPQAGGMGNNEIQSPGMGMSSYNPGDFAQGQYNVSNLPTNNPGQFNTSNNMGMNNMGQGNPGAPIQNPPTQFLSQPNMYAGANENAQGNLMPGNMSQMNAGFPQRQTMSASSPVNQPMNARNPYGQHSAGIAKFNEMFPGLMQGGDLGFDPMAIAIQMNPANQQSAAMNTMQKMMMSNGEGINRVNASMMQPVINATNAATASISQANQPQTIPADQQNMIPPQMQQQQGVNATAVPVPNIQVPQQQLYTALTGAPSMNQQQVPQKQIYQGQNLQPQQEILDPNTGAVVTGSLPTVYEGSGDPNSRQDGSPLTQSAPSTTVQRMIMEPIYPADTSRHQQSAYMNSQPAKYYQYNTLGQPVEMLPAKVYYTPEPNLPQTLSPQPIASKLTSDRARFSNVKATVSKTSLMGSRPVGRTPSRSQLQHIYNQYKGSQSYTQQNIKPSGNGVSYSEGHINVSQSNAPRPTPVEKVGGDTVVNNAINNSVTYKVEQMPGKVGDVPAANKPLGDVETKPINQSKVRNGLQDQTFTSYASSAAWSFHGANPAPFSTGYRYRPKA